MDKAWIKWVLIVAFIVTLVFVYVSGYRALQDTPRASIAVTPPAPPVLTQRPPALAAGAKPEEYDAYLKRTQQALELDKAAIGNYAAQVTAYKDEINARITAANASGPDRSGRLTAFEKVIKETLGQLVLTPLLAALLVYSGIKVAGDVAASRALGQHTKITAP